MENNNTFEYHTKEELLPFVDKEIQYLGWDDKQHKGSLEQNIKGLWLPFSGGVNALTVKTKLPN